MSAEQIQTAEVTEPDPSQLNPNFQPPVMLETPRVERLSPEEYLQRGDERLKQAFTVEETEGIDASIPHYKAANEDFMASYVREFALRGGIDAEIAPELLLRQAACLRKQAEATVVAPYGEDHPGGSDYIDYNKFDRKAYMEALADRKYVEAWDSIEHAAQEATGVEIGEKFGAAIVAAALSAGAALEEHKDWDKAGDVYEEAESILDTKGHPVFAGIVDETTKEAQVGIDAAHIEDRRLVGEAAIKAMIWPTSEPLLAVAA